jgi:hypothetical protein
LLSQGLLERDGDTLTTRIEYSAGQLNVNGNRILLSGGTG